MTVCADHEYHYAGEECPLCAAESDDRDLVTHIHICPDCDNKTFFLYALRGQWVRACAECSHETAL